MPVVLYSNWCYVKNDLYQVSIVVHDNEQSSVDVSFETDSLDSEFTVFPVEKIDPSLTRINFELIDGKGNANIPRTIPLNHVLSVEQIPRNQYQENPEQILNNNDSTPKGSAKSNKKSIKKQFSEVIIARTPVLREQSNFRRFFSTQSYNRNQTELVLKTIININYVDTSNPIRWNVNKIMLDLDNEDMANELYVNLDQCLSTLKQRPRHLLAFVNPFGGKGRKRDKTYLCNLYIIMSIVWMIRYFYLEFRSSKICL